MKEIRQLTKEENFLFVLIDLFDYIIDMLELLKLQLIK